MLFNMMILPLKEMPLMNPFEKNLAKLNQNPYF